MCGAPRRRYAPPFGFGSKSLGKPFLDDGELSAGCRGKSLPQGARQVWHWCGMRASAVKRWRGGGLHASAGFSSALAYVQPKVEHTSHGSHVLWQRGGFMGRGKNLNLTPNSRKAHRAAYDRDYRAAARLILTLEKRKARDSEMAELQLKALEALKDIDAKREETALGATAVFKDGLASAAVVLKSHFDSRSRTDLTDMKQAMSYMNLQEECAHKSSLPPSAQHVRTCLLSKSRLLTPLPPPPPPPPLTRPPPLVIPLRAQTRKQQRNPTPAARPAPRHSALSLEADLGRQVLTVLAPARS